MNLSDERWGFRGPEHWTLRVPNEDSRIEFARSLERFRKTAAAMRRYTEDGACDRHVANYAAARERLEEQRDDLFDAFGEWSSAKVAQLAIEARRGVQLEEGITTGEYDFLSVSLAFPVLTSVLVHDVQMSETNRYLSILSLALHGDTSFGTRWVHLLRDDLRREARLVDRGPGVVPAMFCRLLAECSDFDLLAIAVSAPRWLAPADITDSTNWAETQLRGAAECNERLHALKAGLKALCEVSGDARAKLDATLARFIGDSVSGTLPFWEWMRLAFAEAQLAGRYELAGLKCELRFALMILDRQCSPYLWQIFLGWFVDLGARLDEALGMLVLSPRKLTRWCASKESKEGLLKQLLRDLSVTMEGDIRKTVQFRHLERAFAKRDTPRQDKLYLLAQYLAFACGYHRKDPKVVMKLKRATIGAFSTWYENFETVHCEVSDLELETPDTAEWQRMVAEEAAARKKADDEVAAWIEANSPRAPVADEEPVDIETPPTGEESFEIAYVHNLGAAEWKESRISAVRHTFAGDLERFLEEHAIETIVPAKSVASAVLHFVFDLNQEQRRLLQGEEIAGVWWRKIKRGKQRIYVLERDGRLFFHLMKRKDWEKAENLERRF